MATRIPALIQLSDPRVAAQLVTCYFSKVQGAHSLLQAYNKLQIHCCETLLQLQNIGKTLQKMMRLVFMYFR